jgi:transposase InsO family protein
MRHELFMAKRKRRNFSPEFKADAVKLVKAGRSVPDVARELDLTDTALQEWVKRADIDAGKGPPGALTTVEREELKPYASGDYRAALAKRGYVASMSRTGDCYDNAVAESLFASLKAEWGSQDYADHDAGHASIGEYIDRFYNPTRRHSHLGYVSPIEFELRSQLAALAA